MIKHFRYALLLVLLLSFGGVLSAEIRVNTDEALAAVVKKAAPEYPPIAKQMRVVGKVMVEITIDTDGSVEDVKVLSGNALLTNAVVNAVKKWKFTPFMVNGAATKAIAALDFDFKI